MPPPLSLFWLRVQGRRQGTTSLEKHLSAPGNTTTAGVAKDKVLFSLP